MSDAGSVEEWVYQGGTFTNPDSWMQGGSGSGGNMILEWNTDVATTRKQVKQKLRESGIQVSYLHPDNGWTNEQYIGILLSDEEWASNKNWAKIPNENQLIEIENKASIDSFGTSEFSLENGKLNNGYWYNNATGVYENKSNTATTGIIPVEPNNTYDINIIVNSSTYITFSLFGKSGNFLKVSIRRNAPFTL